MVKKRILTKKQFYVKQNEMLRVKKIKLGQCCAMLIKAKVSLTNLSGS